MSARKTAREKADGGATSPAGVLRPASIEEVCEAVRGNPHVLPIGGGTKSALSAPPDGFVPLSLAGSGPVTPLDVPPLTARALGVRASARTTEARAFLDFLAGPGNEAFRVCGRAEAR